MRSCRVSHRKTLQNRAVFEESSSPMIPFSPRSPMSIFGLARARNRPKSLFSSSSSEAENASKPPKLRKAMVNLQSRMADVPQWLRASTWHRRLVWSLRSSRGLATDPRSRGRTALRMGSIRVAMGARAAKRTSRWAGRACAVVLSRRRRPPSPKSERGRPNDNGLDSLDCHQ